jgi:hypothetical protein
MTQVGGKLVEGNPTWTPALQVSANQGVYQNLDSAVEAETLLNQVGSTATAFVASANVVSALARIKEFQPITTVVSNETLPAG